MMKYYSAMKKAWNPAIARTGMNLDGTMLSKIGQSEKDKYDMISLRCEI